MPGILKLPLNTAGTDWFCGDIHGELTHLTSALRVANFNPAVDRLICTGDLVDRGPHSLGVLKLFNVADWFHSCQGNHDLVTRLFVGGHQELRSMCRLIGGRWQEEITGEDKQLVSNALADMPLAIEVPMADGTRIGVIHADLPLGARWEDLDGATADYAEARQYGDPIGVPLMWGRKRVRYAAQVAFDPNGFETEAKIRYAAGKYLAPIQGIDTLVMGHSSIDGGCPLFVESFRWIDTGCGFDDGTLTLWNPRNDAIVSIVPTGNSSNGQGPSVHQRGAGWSVEGEELIQAENEFMRGDY